VRRTASGWLELVTNAKVTVRTRSLLIATGVQDAVPRWAFDHYGRTVHHCGDCDGPSYRGKPVVAVGPPHGLLTFARHLATWASIVHAVSPGRVVARRPKTTVDGKIRWHKGTVAAMQQGPAAVPLRVFLDDQSSIDCSGAFFLSRRRPRLDVVRELGLRTFNDGLLQTDRRHRTSARGVFAAGDVTHGSQLAIVAAAEGAMAAIQMNAWLGGHHRKWKS
jgi:thioredoxin reductase